MTERQKDLLMVALDALREKADQRRFREYFEPPLEVSEVDQLVALFDKKEESVQDAERFFDGGGVGNVEFCGVIGI